MIPALNRGPAAAGPAPATLRDADVLLPLIQTAHTAIANARAKIDQRLSNPICALAVLQNGVSKSENEAHTFCL
jgi:hypothetical protein